MSRSCKECAHHNPDFVDKPCLHCSWPEFAGEPSNFKPKPITNYDRIISKTPEEMAAWIADHPVVSEYDENNPQHKAWLDWLKEEVEDS